MGEHSGPDRSRAGFFHRGLHSDVPVLGPESPTKVLTDLGRSTHYPAAVHATRRIVLSSAGVLSFAGLASWAIISAVSAGHPAGGAHLSISAPPVSAAPSAPGEAGSPVPTVPASPGPALPPVTIASAAPLRSPQSPRVPGPVSSPMLALDHGSTPATGPGAGTSVAAPTYWTRPPAPPSKPPAPPPASHPTPTPANRPPSATPTSTPTSSSQAPYTCAVRIPGSAYAKWWVKNCRPNLDLIVGSESPSPSPSETLSP